MPTRRRSGFWRGIAPAVVLAATVALAAVAFVWASLERLSRTDLTGALTLAEPLRIFSADGQLMAAFGTERRRPVAFADMPRRLIDAFVAAEDARFFHHPGVDLRGLGRAAVRYLQTGEPREGGSTITMQVVRNFLLSPDKRFERKLTEVLMALELERRLSKEDILSLYLNKVFFGFRAHGVAAAAELYYGKSLAELTLAESAMLAAIPKAPSAVNPIAAPRRALARRNYVLGRMHALGYIDATAYRSARAAPDGARLREQAPALAAGYAAEMARAQMVERYGDGAYKRGYRVHTSIDARLQTAAQRAVRQAVLAYDQRHGYRGPESRHPELTALDGPAQTAAAAALLAQAQALPGLTAGVVLAADARSARVELADGSQARLGLTAVAWARPFLSADRQGPRPRRVDRVLGAGDLVRLRRDAQGQWLLSQRPQVAAALLVLAPEDGRILAMVGGYDFAASQFNRAVHAQRQPGSAFKPFVYAAALAQGWTPASLVRDEPVSVRLSRTQVWEPANFDHRALGPIRLRTALVRSRNLAAVNLLDQVGVERARGFATGFGFDPMRMPQGLTLALGTGTVSLLEMARAYAVFANGGYRVRPHLILRVTDQDGTVAPVTAAGDAGNPRPPQRVPVLEPRIAYQMHTMLQDVIQAGTARRARALGRADIAGKTGTTNDVRDAWFCGYQRDLVAIAWMGFDDSSPLGAGETGGQSALALWMDFMSQALADKSEGVLRVPPGLVQIRVDPATGEALGADARGGQREWVREEHLGALSGHSSILDPAVGDEPQTLIEAVY
ncbi:penicillin-binding protein 1A [uncultured Thiohalocapsa sp.]|uniref:penicillin-binding protein 1A n=1 Tax=uncultured Thiohalocapsa sp. TaxID=768990 RepID=UPI0025F5D7B6|nr:PBP1A family penicillin-binding protein [uncultured Thiohalocapsa sp.]